MVPPVHLRLLRTPNSWPPCSKRSIIRSLHLLMTVSWRSWWRSMHGCNGWRSSPKPGQQRFSTARMLRRPPASCHVVSTSETAFETLLQNDLSAMQTLANPHRPRPVRHRSRQVPPRQSRRFATIHLVLSSCQRQAADGATLSVQTLAPSVARQICGKAAQVS